VNVTYAARPPNKKPLRFPVPHDDVTTRLLNWIREIVESNHELVFVSERLRFSFKQQLVGAPVTDAETILWLSVMRRAENVIVESLRAETDSALDVEGPQTPAFPE
jgi:hypothetical protein